MALVKTDTFNLLSKLTFRRLANISKVVASYYISKWRKKPDQWGMPYALSFEPTTACNLSCPECPSGLKSFSRPTGNLKANFFREVIDDIHKDLLYLTFYFQGEPYINPSFLDMVKYAHDKNIYTMTSTNAHFLNDENARKTVNSGLDRLIVSVDGTTQEVYQQYRIDGKLENVLQGARNLVKWKKKLNSKTPYIIFQFLIVAPNEHQIPELYKLAKEVGVDEVKLKTAQIYDYKHGSPLIPKNEMYSRYTLEEDGTYSIKSSLENNCWKLWHSAVITWDGRVVPCCFDKDAKYKMGDLKNNKLKEVWQGTAYQSFRSVLFKGRKEIDICVNCTEGCKVWASSSF